MSTNENTATKPDVYARVTSQIVNAIEQGVGNWRMPWHTSGRFAFSPINAVNQEALQRHQRACLWAVAQSKGYERGEWATYPNGRNAAHKSARARKARRSCSGSSPTCQRDGGRERHGPRPVHVCCSRRYAVFNAAQVDGYTPKAGRGRTDGGTHRIARKRSSTSARACASGEPRVLCPGDDTIQMPPFAAFVTLDYYSTLAHETALDRARGTLRPGAWENGSGITPMPSKN